MDATFWAFVALIIFFAIIAYLKIPGKVVRSLDERAEHIRNELDEARRLCEEAQKLFAEYQRKRKEAESEASEIIMIAEREAQALFEDAKQKAEEYTVRRNKLAEQKILQAEIEAVSAIRVSAIERAIAIASDIISKEVDQKIAGELFKTSLDEVKNRLN